MFETFKVPAMNVAIRAVLSLFAETHDGPREGLWRRYVAHSSHSEATHCLMPSLVIFCFHLTEYLMKNLTESGYSLFTTVKRDSVRAVNQSCATLRSIMFPSCGLLQ